MATVLNFDAEPCLQLMQVCVERAAEAGQARIVRGLQKQFQGAGLGAQFCGADAQSPRSE